MLVRTRRRGRASRKGERGEKRAGVSASFTRHLAVTTAGASISGEQGPGALLTSWVWGEGVEVGRKVVWEGRE
jgi:hypothetical protein